MLVLTRRALERIHVGEDIVISVASIRGDRVRIAIQAPKSMSIRREEVPARKAAVSTSQVNRPTDLGADDGDSPSKES